MRGVSALLFGTGNGAVTELGAAITKGYTSQKALFTILVICFEDAW